LFSCEISLMVISMMVSFIPLRDFKDGWFFPLGILNSSQLCSFTRSQWQSVLFSCEISMMVSFIPLPDLSDGLFCLVARFQWRLVLLCSFTRFQRQTVLFFFVLLRDSKTVVLFFCSFTRFQRQSVLLCYEISMVTRSLCFVQLWDINDGKFYSVIRV